MSSPPCVKLSAAVGYSRSQVLFASDDEVAWICGNSLVLCNVNDNTQRVLGGTSYGIQCFATNRHHGLVAIAEKAPIPMVHVYSVADLARLGTVSPDVELAVSALAFSSNGAQLAVCADEPDLHLSLYDWRKSELLAREPLPAAATQAVFHPLHPDRLVTVGGGGVSVWTSTQLSDRRALSAEAPPDLGGLEPTCCAWFAGGLYLGGAAGNVVALDGATLRPLAPPSDGSPGGTGDVDEGDAGAGASAGAAAAVPTDVCFGNGAVVALCVSRDALAVAAGSAPSVRWFSHAGRGAAAPLQLLCTAELPASAGCLSADVGGEGFA